MNLFQINRETSMNCNCLNEMEEKIAAKFTADLGAEAMAECKAVAFGITDDGMHLHHKTDFKITANAKGYARGKLVSVMASFCPFCGKSTTVPAPKD